MGLLDEVIGAALGSKSGSGQTSPIMMALMALLASRASGGSGTQQPGSLGGLGDLLNQFQQNGLESIIKSWVGTGQNQAISPSQLHQALGPDTVNDLSAQTGLPHDDLLAQLSKVLPGVVDKLTPNGQLPSEGDLLAGPR
jgi:uncharacterized protein YidB (DUF937 family)